MASEKDLIRRGDVLELLYRLKEDKECPKNYGTLLTIISRIWDMPTVDAVEVVRCKDCRHCDPANRHCDHCLGTSLPLARKADDFCSYGAKMDGEKE